MSANKGLSSRAIIGTFFKRLEVAQQQNWVNAVGMYFSSDQESETYKWLGQSPAMREWVGGRQMKGMRENGITITNKHFETGMEIPVSWMRRDKTGQINLRISETVGRAVSHWGSLLSTLIVNAESSVGYDGQYFFDTDHSEGDSGSQSNDITVDISAVPALLHGTTTNPSPEEIRAMVLAAVAQILGLKDDVGEPMNENAKTFLVQVPSAWFANAAAALKSSILGGDSNVMDSLDGFKFQLSVNTRLTWTDKLAVYRTDSDVKPFILQEEQGVMVKAQAEGSPIEFSHDVHQYGIDAWRNVGYGYWQMACLVQAV